MVCEWSDELVWSGTPFTGGPASVTFNGLADTPPGSAPRLWSTTFDVRLAEEEEEEESDEEGDDEEFDDEEFDDDDFDDDDFDDDFDDDEDDEDEDEEEEADEDEDY